MSPLFRRSRDHRDSGSHTAASERRRLVKEVIHEAREILRELGERGLSREVVRAMLRVPRELFVPGYEGDLAYANTALAIGHGQTISQPLIVALMTHLLNVSGDDTVLEIGTGSGYQAAILSEIVNPVYSVEVIEALGSAASERLKQHGYDNVSVRIGDGARGWPEHAPYDGIIVTAAAPRVPQTLVDQLAPGKRIVIPIGGPLDVQWLSVVTKGDDSDFDVQKVLPVRFVPFTGGGG